MREFYQKYGPEGLYKILETYEMSLLDFYNILNDFYLKVAQNITLYNKNENDHQYFIEKKKNFILQFDHHYYQYKYDTDVCNSFIKTDQKGFYFINFLSLSIPFIHSLGRKDIKRIFAVFHILSLKRN